MDGARKVYVADSGCQQTQLSCQSSGHGGQLDKISWHGSACGLPQALLTASTDTLDGTAVDGSGGVFFTNGLSSYAGEIPRADI